MGRVRRSDAVAAFCALALGAFGIWQSFHYAMGGLRQMGPGAFPLGLSVLLTLAGIGILAESYFSARKAPTPGGEAINARALLVIIAAIAIFALLLEPAGLVPAIVACVVIASLAERRPQPLTIGLLAVGLATVCVLIFITLLHLPLRPFAW